MSNDIESPIGAVDSRIAAAVSPQSDPIAHREALEALFEQGRARFAAGQVPRPAFWGGYRLVPHAFEFWQGRENRLHDRLRFSRTTPAEAWRKERLYP